MCFFVMSVNWYVLVSGCCDMEWLDVSQADVQLVSYEGIVLQVTKFLASIKVDGVVVLFAFVGACYIAFSISLPVISCAVLYAVWSL